MSDEILTADEVIDMVRPAVDAMTVAVFEALSNRDAAIARALRAALDSPDPFPALRSLLSALSPQGTGETPEPDLAAQVRARLGAPGPRSARCSVTLDVLSDGPERARVEWCRMHGDNGPGNLMALAGESVEACLRAVLAAEPEVCPECAERAAPTEPGPTERVDVSRRYHYDPVSGVFVLPYGDHLAGLQASPLNMDARGLSVRVVYTYAPADREAAEDVARVWEERLRERGAKGVDMVGEAET